MDDVATARGSRVGQRLLFSLLAARRGDGNAIWRDSRDDVERLAEYCWRRTVLPEAIERADVEQEVFLALWEAALGWDPNLGPRLVAHSVWCAIVRTKKWLHAQRSAKGRRSSREPSRIQIPISKIQVRSKSEESAELSVNEKLDLFAEPDESIDRIVEALDHYRRLVRKMTPKTATVVMALVASAGSEAGAVESIWLDREKRKIVGAKTKRRAEKVVREVAKRFRKAA